MTAEPKPSTLPDAHERLAALERRGDELEAFSNAMRQANKWIREHGTDSMVAELRQARDEHRRMKMGTPSTLVLLAHIDRLEAELGLAPLVKP